MLGLAPADAALASATLDCVLNCCVRHEHNRQNFVRNGVLLHLDKLASEHPAGVARVWQALVQDDDVRVPFGQAHDNARSIVEDHQALSKLGEAIQGERERQMVLEAMVYFT